MEFVSGADELVAQLKSLAGETFAKVLEAVEKTAVDVQNHAKANHERGLAHSKGRYENQTNALTGGIFTETVEATEQAIEAQVFSTMEYGPYLEYGTSRHAPYPFMGPAADANAEVFQRRIAEVVK